MLKKRNKQHDAANEMGGQDSFLDIVSNIVGILIILVMIAGVRAQYSASESDETISDMDDATAPISTSTDVQDRYAGKIVLDEVEARYRDYMEKTKKAEDLHNAFEAAKTQTAMLEVHFQAEQKEHRELFDLLMAAREEIDILAEEKSQETKEKIELQRQIQESEAKLAQLDRTKNWIEANRPKATVLENIPTPISKTVEEKEAHFRLLNGKIVYVPLTELFEKMKLEVAANKNRYFKQKASAGSIGPLENFVLEYNLVTYDVMMRDAYGSGLGTRLELEYAECVPVHDQIGQTLREALAAPSSELKNRLRLYRQDLYTITVWVYPDSFEEFRELKKFLYSHGYRVAARPMEFGQPISGSPYGTKSASQ